MAAWIPQKGATLFMPTGGTAGRHLFIVLNDPANLDGHPPGMCLLTCVCSIPAVGVFYDTQCLLATGCHPFVVHESYVAYKHTRLESMTSLLKGIADGVFQPHDPCGDPPLSEIRAGIEQSRHIRRCFKNLPL